jgi:hypothetical protein
LTTVNMICIDRSASLEDPLAGDRSNRNRKHCCRLADLLAERAAERTAGRERQSTARTPSTAAKASPCMCPNR